MIRELPGSHQHLTIDICRCLPLRFQSLKTIPLRLACRILETVSCDRGTFSYADFEGFKGSATHAFLIIQVRNDSKVLTFRFLEGDNPTVDVDSDEMTIISEAGEKHTVRFFTRIPQNIELLTQEDLGLVITPEMVLRFLEHPSSIFFDGAEVITVAASEMLGAFQGNELCLNGLKQISTTSAAHLASFQGNKLFLDGLKEIDDSTAMALSKFKGDWLSLDGLTALDVSVAESLATFQGKALFLSGLPTMTEYAARSLSSFKGRQIILLGLRSLDDKATEHLVEFSGWLSISYFFCGDDVDLLLSTKGKAYVYTDVSGLRKLDAKLAHRLARQGQVFFHSLRSIGPEEARILCEKGSNLDNIEFSSLRSLSLESCYEIGKTYASGLTLGGIQEFTDEQAQALTAFRRKVVRVVTALYRNLPIETVDIEDMPATFLSELAAEIPKRKDELDALYSSGKQVTPSELMHCMECFYDHNFISILFSLPDVQELSDSAFKTLNDAGFNIDPPSPLATEPKP